MEEERVVGPDILIETDTVMEEAQNDEEKDPTHQTNNISLTS